MPPQRQLSRRLLTVLCTSKSIMKFSSTFGLKARLRGRTLEEFGSQSHGRSALHCAANTCSMMACALSGLPRRLITDSRPRLSSRRLSRSPSSVADKSSGMSGMR